MTNNLTAKNLGLLKLITLWSEEKLLPKKDVMWELANLIDKNEIEDNISITKIWGSKSWQFSHKKMSKIISKKDLVCFLETGNKNTAILYGAFLSPERLFVSKAWVVGLLLNDGVDFNEIPSFLDAHKYYTNEAKSQKYMPPNQKRIQKSANELAQKFFSNHGYFPDKKDIVRNLMEQYPQIKKTETMLRRFKALWKNS